MLPMHPGLPVPMRTGILACQIPFISCAGILPYCQWADFLLSSIPSSECTYPGAKSEGAPLGMQFYEDNCLLEQRYVKDDAKKIQEVLKDAGKAVGADVQIQGFVRFQCGEGLESEQSSFADDVAHALQQTG